MQLVDLMINELQVFIKLHHEFDNFFAFLCIVSVDAVTFSHLIEINDFFSILN